MTGKVRRINRKLDRVEIFAQAIVAGESQSDAYIKAHPAAKKWKKESVHTEAYDMLRDEKVVARLAELRKKSEAENEWSRNKSIQVLINIALNAKLDGDKIKAVDKLNVMLGYNAPQKVDLTSSDGTMSPKPPILDVSKLSEQAMREFLNARNVVNAK